MISNNRSLIEMLGNQTFIVDPEFQGFGLRGMDSAYSNKFFILTNGNGAYISACSIPKVLLAYYNNVGVEVAKPENILGLEKSFHDPDKSLLERIQDDREATSLLKRRAKTTLVPYMVTNSVEQFARRNNYTLLASAKDTQYMANKARLQEELERKQSYLQKTTGYNLTIPSIITQRGNTRLLAQAYDELSEGGRKAVVVTKPESVSAFGIFVHTPSAGIKGFNTIVNDNFAEGEEILLRAFFQHNHSPSLQGGRLRKGSYNHLYLGRQLITYTTSLTGEKVTYDSNQVPFSSKVVTIRSDGIASLAKIDHALGSAFIEGRGIAGIAGFDAVVNINPEGHLLSVGITEVNLHLPGSIASYAATCKLFPSGFDGVAHNFRLPFPAGMDSDTFMRNNQSRFIQKKESYGIFPINVSYRDKVDIIIFAQDINHLQKMQASIVL